jgi:hypothetical protein
MPSVGGKENFQSFTVICRKPHVASSICLRATIFQNPKGTLWTHCTLWSGGFTVITWLHDAHSQDMKCWLYSDD